MLSGRTFPVFALDVSYLVSHGRRWCGLRAETDGKHFQISMGVESLKSLCVLAFSGDHAGGESKQNINREKRIIKSELAASKRKPGAARASLIDGGHVQAQYIPTERQITRTKTAARSASLASLPGGSPDELRVLITNMQWQESLGPTDIWVDVDRSVTDSLKTVVPFTTKYLLQSGAEFIRKCEAAGHPVCVTMDGTHDVCREQLKLLGLCLVGTSWDAGHAEWCSTLMPLFFALSCRETKQSFSTLIEAAADARARLYDILLQAIVKHIFVDGAPELAFVAHLFFEAAEFHRCLQHVKARFVSKIGGAYRKETSTYIEWTAFIPNEFLFHAVWDVILDRLVRVGKNSIANYLKEGVLTVGDNGLYSAPWQSSYLHVVPSRFTYTPNTIERLWKTPLETRFERCQAIAFRTD